MTSIPGFFLVLPIFGLALFNAYSLNFAEGYQQYMVTPVNISSYLTGDMGLSVMFYGDSMAFLASMFSLIYCPFVAYRFVALGVGGRLNNYGYTACVLFLVALVILLAAPLLWSLGMAGVSMKIYFMFCLPCLFILTMFVGVEIWKLRSEQDYELQTVEARHGR